MENILPQGISILALSTRMKNIFTTSGWALFETYWSLERLKTSFQRSLLSKSHAVKMFFIVPA
jgi:hypothetical protein